MDLTGRFFLILCGHGPFGGNFIGPVDGDKNASDVWQETLKEKVFLEPPKVIKTKANHGSLANARFRAASPHPSFRAGYTHFCFEF